MLKHVFVAILVSLLVAGCSGGDDDEAFPLRVPAPSPTLDNGPVIGLVGTMTGATSWRGVDAFEGADVGVHVLNQRGNPAQLPFELVTVDDKGDPDRATDLLRELAGDDRTVGIIYAGPPEGLPPAEDALAQAEIPALLLYGDLYSGNLLRDDLFQMSPPYAWQARRLLAYAYFDRGYRRIGVLTEQGFDGDAAATSIQAARQSLGRSGLRMKRYDLDSDDLESSLEELKESGAQAIVFHGGPTATTRLLQAIDELDARYRDTKTARAANARGGRKRRGWHPQILTFDTSMAPSVEERVPTGTVAAETYGRGAHYLPVPSFQNFHEAFVAWWDTEPLGWELRAFDAVQAIGNAARRTAPRDSVTRGLESLDPARYGGLDMDFSSDDHTAVQQSSVGLWVVPRGRDSVREREKIPNSLPWVPLQRGFSTDGKRTEIAAKDWRYLFRGEPEASGRAPLIGRARFGITSDRKDPAR